MAFCVTLMARLHHIVTTPPSNELSVLGRITLLLASAVLTRTFHQWDQLIPQAEFTLNLLQGTCLNPKLSAWAQLYCTFDYNHTPIASPEIRVLVHKKYPDGTTWSPHASYGWYIGPALESYHCFPVWIWETQVACICDTISWLPTKVTMPLASSNDLVLVAGI
jgi:hypothetical protein